MNAVEVYKRFAPFYDQYVGDFCDDLPLYLRLCENKSSVVEIGCGTGRVLKALLEKGLNVTGIDVSPEMLAIARSKLSRFLDTGKLRIFQHDLGDAPLPEQYQIVLVTFYTYNYFLRDEDAISFLSNAYRSIQPNGVIVLDLFFPKVMTEPAKNDMWEIRTILNESGAISLRMKRRMSGKIEERIQFFKYGAIEEEITTFRRFYPKREVFNLLTQAGFENIQLADGYAESSFHDLTDDEQTRSGFVAKAFKGRTHGDWFA